MAKVAQHVRYYPGDVVIEEDDLTGRNYAEWFLCLVEEGSVEIVRRGEVKHEVMVGHYFGAIPMFSGKPAKATARVKEQCKIFRLPEDVVKRLDKEVIETILAGAGNKYL